MVDAGFVPSLNYPSTELVGSQNMHKYYLNFITAKDCCIFVVDMNCCDIAGIRQRREREWEA